ncbi:MAG: sporulation protein YqfD [Clostridia bacterium]|nr:sporulation protein YqfD [Clostridia bacterium]
MRSFLHFLTGSRTLRFGAASAGEVMNLCRHYGFVYWNLRFCGEHLCLDASLITSTKLCSACRERGISVVSEGERGLPSLLLRYRRRFGLLVGALCFFLIILFSGRVLWGIEIDGNHTLSDEEVLSELRACGLTVGCRLSELDTEVLENRVLIFSDEISWISVNLIGTVAHVELREVEELPPDEPNFDASNLVAARSGKIELLENIRGSAVVSIGDLVVEGELLVSGLSEMQSGGVRYRCAEGQVFARTERDFLVEIPYAYQQKRYTGRKKSEKSLIFFEKEIKFFSNCRNLPATCDTINTVEYFSLWDGRTLPVGIRTVEYREYEMCDEVRDATEAISLAYECLYEQMEAEELEGSLVRKSTVTEISDDALILRCRAEYIENIAIVKEIEIGNREEETS